MKYKRIPKTVDAIQWLGYNIDEAKEFLGDSFIKHTQEHHRGGASTIYISYHDTVVEARVGAMLLKDWSGICSVMEAYRFQNDYKKHFGE